jgi:hypothetical protein
MNSKLSIVAKSHAAVGRNRANSERATQPMPALPARCRRTIDQRRVRFAAPRCPHDCLPSLSAQFFVDR